MRAGAVEEATAGAKPAAECSSVTCTAQVSLGKGSCLQVSGERACQKPSRRPITAPCAGEFQMYRVFSRMYRLLEWYHGFIGLDRGHLEAYHLRKYCQTSCGASQHSETTSPTFYRRARLHRAGESHVFAACLRRLEMYSVFSRDLVSFGGN